MSSTPPVGMRSHRQRTGASSGGVIAIVAAVVVLGVAAVFFMRGPVGPGLPSIERGQQTVEAFLTSVRSGKAGAAWDTTTAEFKSLEGRESFARSANKQPLYKKELQFVSSQEVEVMGQPRREMLYQEPKTGASVRVLLASEAGEWRVDRLSW